MASEIPPYPASLTRIVDCRICIHAKTEKRNKTVIWSCVYKKTTMGITPYFKKERASLKVRFPDGMVSVLCDFQAPRACKHAGDGGSCLAAINHPACPYNTATEEDCGSYVRKPSLVKKPSPAPAKPGMKQAGLEAFLE